MRIEIIAEQEGWWYNKGERYTVGHFPYRATEGGALDKCDCVECVVERLGKSLYDMFEVLVGEYAGSIIPVKACKVVE